MSLDINVFLKAVKQASVDAVMANGPMGVCYGVVTSVEPLKIAVDQKKVLSGEQLILTNSVRDFAIKMTVDHATEAISHGHPVTDTYTGGGSAGEVSHAHPYQGTKLFQVHLGLRIGEKVLLLRCDGGQKFIVLDRWEAPK